MTKKVLVTGVSSGIGRAQAQAFLEAGYKVYGVDKGEDPGLAGKFRFLQLDLTQDLEPLFSWCPQVHILCNTAGVLDDYQTLMQISQEDIGQVFEINVFAAMRISRFYLEEMLAQGQGVLINMCSIASSLAGGGGVAYTAAKHALAGFTKQLALEVADQGIQVFGLAPGAVKTAMTAKDFEPGGLADWVAAETPIKRWILPEEIAEASVFLASGKMSAMQGEIINMDGGWSIK